MRVFMLLLVAGLLPALGFGQKFLQLEKANKARTEKFYLGEEITYRLKGESDWITATLTDVQMDSQRVALDLKPVRVADIDALRLQYPGIVRGIGPSLMIFGASWAGFSLLGAAFDNYELTASTAIVSGTGLASGFIFYQIFKHKRVKMSARKRLRAVEVPVSFGPGNGRK
ncbi:MAG: hypothetical protein IT260_00640 [Saprospiraceae bacterium]|nr:hypothetical protein [Saprospiraceae bacterium]